MSKTVIKSIELFEKGIEYPFIKPDLHFLQEVLSNKPLDLLTAANGKGVLKA